MKMGIWILLVFVSCTLKGSKNSLRLETHTEIPKNAFEVFNNFGCNNCHTMPPSDYTEYGKEMLKKGFGCISLQTLAKKHSLYGEARRVFIKNGCVKCHNPDGRGVGEKNLTGFGLEVDKRGLGCVGTLKVLSGEKR